MAHRPIVLPSAEADLEALDPRIRRRVLRRFVWLRENAEHVVHHRLANMPDDLAGLCRYRVGQYRILYWVYPDRRLLKIYHVGHRRDVYKRL
ncbi:MAG: type II toxin-antitoxin system RelE family toxin [Planctomycetota bacterium]